MKPRILFVCVHNSCRSQMAEGFAKMIGKNKIEVRSGGTEEGHQVDPLAIEIMLEKGIDISNQKSKIVDFWEWADRIIVMGCDAEESCPVSVSSKLENWDLDNPKGKPLEEYRRVRDEIEIKMKKLIEEY
ncbi:MAG: arsenate reductase ArsC [Candidatus Heimdallarchaeota archaeon]|nr:arsenate reductase ArsC [Candidatus Heimdallarchaeota archaeon]MCK4955517.1 arsenate reductase ArsC [Candidatus Heimdallarchaeota archaeon]